MGEGGREEGWDKLGTTHRLPNTRPQYWHLNSSDVLSARRDSVSRVNDACQCILPARSGPGEAGCSALHSVPCPALQRDVTPLGCRRPLISRSPALLSRAGSNSRVASCRRRWLLCWYCLPQVEQANPDEDCAGGGGMLLRVQRKRVAAGEEELRVLLPRSGFLPTFPGAFWGHFWCHFGGPTFSLFHPAKSPPGRTGEQQHPDDCPVGNPRSRTVSACQPRHLPPSVHSVLAHGRGGLVPTCLAHATPRSCPVWVAMAVVGCRWLPWAREIQDESVAEGRRCLSRPSPFFGSEPRAVMPVPPCAKSHE